MSQPSDIREKNLRSSLTVSTIQSIIGFYYKKLIFIVSCDVCYPNFLLAW